MYLNYALAAVSELQVIHLYKIIKSPENGSEIMSKDTLCERHTRREVKYVLNNRYYSQKEVITALIEGKFKACPRCLEELFNE